MSKKLHWSKMFHHWRIFFFSGIDAPMARPGLIATFVITLAFCMERIPVRSVLTNSSEPYYLVTGQNSQRGNEVVVDLGSY
jgi:multiple sugar transport system permease protein